MNGPSEDGDLKPTLPRMPWPTRVALRWLLTAEERAVVEAELRELWERRRERDGEAEAARWYARQARGYPVRLVLERLRRRGSGGLDREARSAGGGGAVLPEILADLRHALRSLRRSPVLALTIVSTVGVGLGASIAMFAVVREVLLDPLPYAASDRLVRIYHAVRDNRWNLSVADYQAIEAQQTHFDGIAAYTTGEQTLVADGSATRVRVRGVTASWFDLLGLRVAQGRTFDAADGVPGAPATAVLSWGFWQRQFGGASSVIGRQIRLDDRDYTVVGVLPQAVGPFEERFDVFPVLQMEPPARKGPFMLTVVGRLRTGAAPANAESELRAINRRIFPIWQAGWQDSTATWGMMPLDEFVIGRYRPLLYVLLGAVLMVLLVASTNAAGLLTARRMQRQTELATRAALGASSSRLARLLLVESLVLACAGAVLGLGLAAAVVRVVRAAGPDLLPGAGRIALDGGALGFAALLVCGSVLLFGVLPVAPLRRQRRGIAETLRASVRTASGDVAAHRLRRVLVAMQFAIVLPLLAGATLLLISFLKLQRVDPGFEGSSVLTLRIPRTSPPDTSTASALLFWQELQERVRALPGVEAVGLNTSRPPTGADNINNFDPLDRPTPPGESERTAVWSVASPGYFAALRIGLVAGRMFDEREDPAARVIVALVDRTWAQSVYPGESPIGKRMYEGGCRAPTCRLVEVVGVVEDVRYLGLDDRQAGMSIGTVYVPQSQWLPPATNLFVRTAGDPMSLLPSIRRIVRELDPTIAITGVVVASDLVDRALAAPRNLAVAVGAFALVALALAMIGIYGVMSYFVNEHRKDIGIRLVLGGAPVSVVRLVLRRGMTPVLAGTAIGLVLAAGMSGFLARLLHDVSPRDPAALLWVTVALLLTALGACWLPARQAARMDPAEVLREN